MFTFEIPENLRPEMLNIGELEKFEDKIAQIYEHISMKNILCTVSNFDEVKFGVVAEPQLQVTGICVSSGTPSYLKSVLKDCIEILTNEIKKHVEENTEADFDEVSKLLQTLIRLCYRFSVAYDFFDSLGFSQRHIFWVYHNGIWIIQPSQNLHFPQQILDELDNHYLLRKQFFEKLSGTIQEIDEWHHYVPSLLSQAYKWDSLHAELELAEVIEAIEKHRLKINGDKGGSHLKFRKQFYGLFGLTGKSHNQKLQQIRQRKNEISFIKELARLVSPCKK